MSNKCDAVLSVTYSTEKVPNARGHISSIRVLSRREDTLASLDYYLLRYEPWTIKIKSHSVESCMGMGNEDVFSSSSETLPLMPDRH